MSQKTARAPRCREWYVRFGSKADICSAKGHVRFTPESRHSPQRRDLMSVQSPIVSFERAPSASDIDTGVVDSLKALDLKRPIREADILQRDGNVRFGPKADIDRAATVCRSIASWLQQRSIDRCCFESENG